MTDIPLSTSLPEGIQMLSNLVFSDDAERPRRLHVLRPAPLPDLPSPVIVWIFGGAFRAGNKEQDIAKLLPFVQHGYCVVTIDYRLSSEALFPAQVHDCLCAVRYVRAHSTDLHINPAAIGVWGESSGGYLATMIGVGSGIVDLEGHAGWPNHASAVQAVCDWYGPTNFALMDRAGSSMRHDAPDSPESQLVGAPIQEVPDRVTRANPITYITPHRRYPPFLIMHGDRDPLVPFNQSEILVHALRRQGVNVDFIPVINGGHGGEMFTTDDVYDTVLRFFDTHLRPSHHSTADAAQAAR